MIRALIPAIALLALVSLCVAWHSVDEYSPTGRLDVRTLKHCVHVRGQNPGVCPGRWCDAPTNAGYAPGTMLWRWPACPPWSWPL